MNGINRIYISRFPPTVTQDILIKIFEQQTGTSPKSVIFREHYALIDLVDDYELSKAIDALNGYEVMGSQLLVEPSLNPRRIRGTSIHVTNIPEHFPWDDFKHLLSNFGNFQHCEKGIIKQNTYSATVTYESQEQAQQARLQLGNYEIQPGLFLQVEPMENGRRPGRGPRGGPGSRPYNSGHYRNNDFPLRILVLSDMVGAIIGRAGGTIRQITQQSRARVDVHRKENAGSPEKVITIYGSPESCSTACQKIMEIMQQEANSTNRGDIPLKILAHNSLIGRIIGKNGSTIKRIMEQSDAKIAVSSNMQDCASWNVERVITVKGSVESMSKAEKMVSAKLRQSFENDMAMMAHQAYMFPGAHPMSMMSTGPPHRSSPPSTPYGMYGPPCMGPPPPPLPPPMEIMKETVLVHVPNSCVGALIGTGGSNIRDMIGYSGASIKVTQPKDESPEKPERTVCIIGTPDAQWKAQFLIFKKVCTEIFRGPQEYNLKVEILVPTQQVGRIIGKGGTTVRELQRQTRAIIKFPEDSRDSNAEETSVHIIGDFFCSMAAQRQIRSLVYKSANFPPQRRRSQPTLSV